MEIRVRVGVRVRVRVRVSIRVRVRVRSLEESCGTAETVVTGRRRYSTGERLPERLPQIES